MDQGDKVAPREVKGQDLSSESCRSSPSSVTLETPKETESTTNLPPSTQPGSPPEPERSEVQNQNQGGAGSAHGSPPAPAALPSGPKVHIDPDSLKCCHLVTMVTRLLVSAGEADQPEEAVVGANGSRPEGQVQPPGSAAGRLAGGRVRPGPEGHLRGTACFHPEVPLVPLVPVQTICRDSKVSCCWNHRGFRSSRRLS